MYMDNTKNSGIFRIGSYNDQDLSIRSPVDSTLGSVFSFMPDKQQAWEDLYRLANDEVKLNYLNS